MDIFLYLEKLDTMISRKDWQEAENYFYSLCSQLAGKEQADEIRNVDLSFYREALHKQFLLALSVAEEEESKALYFEYDMDNGWEGAFFLCEDYKPRSEEDDDWASEFTVDIDGPDCKEFASVYEQNGFDRTDIALGTTMYMVTRTALALAEAVMDVQTALPVCIAFHDQDDPIFRIKE